MNAKILADEGLNGLVVRELRKTNDHIDWILESNPGISDRQVIEIAKAKNQILITEDKDFGEWVFAHEIKGLTIIFLRYNKHSYSIMLQSLIIIISEVSFQKDSNDYEFITINKNKIRRRKI